MVKGGNEETADLRRIVLGSWHSPSRLMVKNESILGIHSSYYTGERVLR
jgi:hypothetical protein